MNFNSDSIELFLAVIERGSFSAAARALGDAGYARTSGITWDGVVDRLMADG